MATRLELQQIRNPACTACALHTSSVNVCVMSRGSPRADIMLVGEAPGENEAKFNKPFMGPAGQLLNEILDELEMRHLVYITNICKCRPPDNRKPKSGEVSTCTKLYLRKELKLIKPKVVVALGRVPIDFFFAGEPFRRGQVYRLSTYPFSIIPTWHPSYCVRGYDQNSTGQLRDALLLARKFEA
jgi:uracil-DNA glycosylase